MSKEAALAMMSSSGAPVAQAEAAPQAATPAPETVTEGGGAVDPQKSPAFHHLAKKEAELFKQRDDIKREREQWNSERQRLEQAKKEYDEYITAKQTNPVDAIKKLGFTETDLMNWLAAEEKPEPTSEERAAQIAKETVEAQLKMYEEAQQKKAQEVQLAHDQKLIHGYRAHIDQMLSQNKDKYEYCAYYGNEAKELAYEITRAVAKESGGIELITPEEAIALAEEAYEEKDRNMNTIKKRQSHLAQTESAKAQPSSHPPDHVRQTTLVEKPAEKETNPNAARVKSLSSLANTTIASTRMNQQESRDQKRARLMQKLQNGG